MIASTPVRRLGTYLVIISTLSFAGCGASDGNGSGASGSNTIATSKPIPAPVIESFTADPAQVAEGQSTVLSWTISDPNATLRISPLSEAIAGSSVTITPVFTTTYTLTASNSLGSDMSSVTVVVSSGPSGTGTPVITAANPAANAEWVNAATNLAGMPSDCGNLSYISTNPTRDMVIASVALHGLWASVDGSDQWAQLGQGPGADQITNRATGIIYDPTTPDVFWESGTYSGGVYRTDDNGNTFHQLGNIGHIDQVGIDLTDPQRQTMLAGMHEKAILYRSTDGGRNWKDISSALPANIGFATAPVVIDKNTFLLGTASTSASGVFRSTDQGNNWKRVNPIGAVGRPITRADGSMYWLLEAGYGMIKSTDGGETWNEVSGLNGTGAASLIELPDNGMATLSGTRILVSHDDGVTWSQVGPDIPGSPNGIAYSKERNAFYAWHFDCSFEDQNPIKEDSIMRLDLGAPLTG